MSEKGFWDYWFKAEEPDADVINLSKELKQKGLKVFILSNNFKERADYYNHYKWMHDTVDKAYFSWQTGFVKPDVRAWEFILAEYNLLPEECIYFDDQEKNVNVASSIGICSYLFSSALEARQIINNIT